MNKVLPGFNIPTPQFRADLVPLPYHQDILLDPQTNTRWKLEGDSLVRDHDGEATWSKMAGYVGKTYYDVFMDTFRSALDNK
jgi:hypothetical protein